MMSIWSLLLAVTLWTLCFKLSSTEVPYRYHSTAQLETFLKDAVRRYPQLTNLYSVGQSTQGRELWVLALGPNANRHVHLRPEVKYVANMHGNEVTGREMLIHLIDHLLTNYYTNGTIKSMLDTTRIHVMVSMNPDGFENATEYVRRNNQRRCVGTIGRFNRLGWDLNRNFPDYFEDNLRFTPRAKEVQAVMKWSDKVPFVVSANFHDGAVVANFPYENYHGGASRHHFRPKYSEAPDDDVFRHLARTYSFYHKTMHYGDGCDGSKGKFKDGITNGAEWYPVKGGMQDYNYVYQGTYELTLELSCCKYPPESELQGLWYQNKEALIAYLNSVHMGIKGVVVDQNGAPVEGAEVRVKGRSHPVHTTRNGEYWRLLMPGKTYTIQVYKPNSDYIPTERDITLFNFNPVIVNFTLEKRHSSQMTNTQLSGQSPASNGGVQYRRFANSLSPPVFLYWMYYYS